MKRYLITKAITIFSLVFACISYAQTSTENYIQSKTCLTGDCTKKSEIITYFDGLGRAKQVIAVKVTPTGKDMVTPVTYDGFGRQVKDILPVPVATQNSLIHTSITDENSANTYYGVSNAYSEKELEKSPLDRILSQANPGDEWKMSSGHTQKFKYETNAASEVKKFVTTTTINTVSGVSNTISALSIPAGSAGLYTAGILYKNTITDEDGNPVIQFKNGRGQTLLIRKTDGTQNLDTYYVYNEYNQQAFVIPPQAVKKIEQNNNTVTATILNELCYQYKYDGQDRLVEKKLPGKDWEFFVYDKQDRLVFVQDGVLRTLNNTFNTKGWLFTKYDEFGRVVYTGFFSNTATRQVLQSILNNLAANPYNNEKRSNTPFNLLGVDIYYDNKGYPTTNMKLLTTNYYDTYPQGAESVPTVLGQYTLPHTLGSSDDASTKGLQTASYVRNIEDEQWTRIYSYYDSKGRVIATKSTNHLGGYTNKDLKLNFTGLVDEAYTYHAKTRVSPEVVVKERFIYDDQGRMLKNFHQVDSNPEELLAENTYNELSQLTNKKVGSVSGSAPLQSIDYSYNIRGWLSEINKSQMAVSNLGGKLFAYKIKYTSRDGIENPDAVQFPGKSVIPKYNGNIAEVDWRAVQTLGDYPSLTPKRYGYSYDKSDRLTAGYYQNPNNPNSKENTESLAYDPNGNITSLYRTSVIENGSTIATLIDNLAYDYQGNRAIKIKDNSGNNTGYEGTAGNPIEYDLNGNMKNMVDKQITGIGYNYLNLPNTIAINLGQVTSDIATKYRADGIKVRKENTKTSIGIAGTTITKEVTDYLDGFQYYGKTTSGPGSGPGDPGTSSLMTDVSERAFEVQAFTPITIIEPGIDPVTGPITLIKDPELQFFPTAEGFYDYQKNQYIYQYKDHLGNTRVSFARNSAGALEIVDSNDYYPFGMNHLKTGIAYFAQSSYKNYKMQGQELQETGWYSFKWRNYMPDVGRFFNIDPLSEKYAYQSHYNFSENRVIDARELEGLEAVDFRKNDGFKNLIVAVQGWSGNTVKDHTQAQNRGDGSIDKTGLGALDQLSSKDTRVVIFDASRNENTKNDIGATISSFNKSHSDGEVVAVGHSLGGDNLVEKVNENKDLKINLMLTLDILDVYSDTEIKSENVSKVKNYYQTKDFYGGEKVTTSDDNKKTEVTNIHAPNSDHRSIDNDLSKKIMEVVKKELKHN
ncbi:DUF6443 domain-containing protein [Chryseobacterium populi]|uniref:RHS repeat-associated core domain protein containing protein n=1 Tax=Chryseobacterium populi TaxID=1144316 RepID=J2STR9_9FLAO|nr:DUF6443 domain-containing protein [Chryseobacterium populi]EJL68982.1 RHS repeat-associated core domain protein containing protein [Chryseobacterium populi]